MTLALALLTSCPPRCSVMLDRLREDAREDGEDCDYEPGDVESNCALPVFSAAELEAWFENTQMEYDAAFCQTASDQCVFDEDTPCS